MRKNWGNVNFYQVVGGKNGYTPVYKQQQQQQQPKKTNKAKAKTYRERKLSKRVSPRLEFTAYKAATA